jgi:hypothetical protein
VAWLDDLFDVESQLKEESERTGAGMSGIFLIPEICVEEVL